MLSSLQRLAAPLSLTLRIGALAHLAMVALFAPWQNALSVLGAPLVLAGAAPFAPVLLVPVLFGVPGTGGTAVAAASFVLALALYAAGRALPSAGTRHGGLVRRRPAVFRWLNGFALALAAAAVLHRDADLGESLLWFGTLVLFGRALPRRAARENRRERAAAWGMAAVSVVVGLLLAEAAARMVLPKSARDMADFFMYHPEIAFTLRPGAAGSAEIRVDEDAFRTMRVEISPQGLRDRVFEAKADGEYRVLVLGDSNAMGWGLDPPDTVSAQLERMLRERWPDGKVSVANAGMGNSGPWQQRVLLRERGFALEPDLVVHQLFIGNDIENTLWKRRLHLAPADTGRGREAFARWSRHGRPAARAEYWLREHTAVYHLWLRAAGHRNWVSEFADSVRLFPRPPDSGQFWSPACPPLADRPINIEMCLAEWPPIVQEGWALFGEDVHAVRADCLARGVDYAAYVQPGPETIVDRVWNFFLQEAGSGVEYERYRDIEEAERFFVETGIPFIPMADTFRNHPDRGSLFIPFDGHPTAAGARLAAEQLAEYLLARFGAAPPPVSGAPVRP